MDDFFSSLKGYVSDRLSSPLLGAYFVSWVIFNFKLFLVVFSNMKIFVKLSWIESYFSLDFFSLLHTWFYPLCVALIYVLVLPYPSRWILSHTLTQNRENLKLRQRIDEETPLTKEAADALKNSLRQKVRVLESDISESEQVAAKLKLHIKDLEERVLVEQVELKEAREHLVLARAASASKDEKISESLLISKSLEKERDQFKAEAEAVTLAANKLANLPETSHLKKIAESQMSLTDIIKLLKEYRQAKTPTAKVALSDGSTVTMQYDKYLDMRKFGLPKVSKNLRADSSHHPAKDNGKNSPGAYGRSQLDFRLQGDANK